MPPSAHSQCALILFALARVVHRALSQRVQELAGSLLWTLALYESLIYLLTYLKTNL